MKRLANEPIAPTETVKIPSPKTADDILDLFKGVDGDDKIEKPVKAEKAEKVEKPESEEDIEKSEGDEDEDEIKLSEPEDEEDVEKLDLDKADEPEIETPPRKKEILKKYPEIFKDFPFLEKVMYRDRQYNELFGSFDDAKEIAGKAEVFASFENQLLEGNTEEILKEVKAADEKAFYKIADNYLVTLSKVDKDAYFHVVGNLNKRLIMEMVEEADGLIKNGDKSNGDNLKLAALLVNQFIFGSAKFTPPGKLAPEEEKTEKADEVEQERLSLVKERFESARDDLQTQVDNTLRATITDYIDPKNVMSAYVKKNAVADAMKILQASIASDSTVAKNLDKLWRVAFERKFDRESLNPIKSFYLSKAKGNLKNAIMKARTEALKGLAPKSEKTEEEIEDSTPKRRTVQPGKTSSQPKKNEIHKGESVTDFFMRD